jgi:hypothetical protein
VCCEADVDDLFVCRISCMHAGSNVAALQTEAVLDLATDEWVIHTPDDGAIKWWIGNAAEDGRAATVFARYVRTAQYVDVLCRMRSLLPRIRPSGMSAKSNTLAYYFIVYHDMDALP